MFVVVEPETVRFVAVISPNVVEVPGTQFVPSQIRESFNTGGVVMVSTSCNSSMGTHDTPEHPGTHLLVAPSHTRDFPSTGATVVVSTSPRVFIEVIVNPSPFPMKDPAVIVVAVIPPVDIMLGAVIVFDAVILPVFPIFNTDVEGLGVLLVVLADKYKFLLASATNPTCPGLAAEDSGEIERDCTEASPD